MSKKQVGKYQLECMIGEGMYGKVYKGIDTSTKSVVAIKMIDSSRLNDRLKSQLEREISIMRHTQSTYLLKLMDVLRTKRNFYMFMEFCEGGDLEKFMKSHGPVSEETARRWFRQLLQAFDELLARNVIHRDLKLANILLTDPDPEKADIKIADFGFARYLTDNSLAVTQCGSPLYMAPEIFKAKPSYNHKADIWSLGAILYEILVGTPAFQCRNLKELIEMHKRGFAIDGNLSISSEAAELIGKMLDTNPETRVDLEEIKQHPFCQVEIEVPSPVPVEVSKVEELKVEEPIVEEPKVEEPKAEEEKEEEPPQVPAEPIPEPIEEVMDSLIEVDEFDEDEYEVIDEVPEEMEQSMSDLERNHQKVHFELEMQFQRVEQAQELGTEYQNKQEFSIAYVVYLYCNSRLVTLLQKADTWMASFNITRENDAVFAEIYEDIQTATFAAQEKIEELKNIVSYEAKAVEQSLIEIRRADSDSIEIDTPGVLEEARRRQQQGQIKEALVLADIACEYDESARGLYAELEEQFATGK